MVPRTTRRRLAEAAQIAPEDGFAAAVVSATLYLVAGASVVVVAILPAVAHGHQVVLTAMATLAVVFSGPVFFLVRSPRTPPWLLHVNQWLALALIPVAVALTGGASSPVWFYVFLVALFTSYFYGRPVAVVYLTVCVGVQALPLLYDPAAAHEPAFLAELICGAPAYLTLGIAISSGKGRSGLLRARAEMQAAEQAALRRVASAVADGASPEQIFTMVATEAGGLLGGAAAAIMRVEAEDRMTIVGNWAQDPAAVMPVGAVIAIPPGSDVALSLVDGRPRVTGRHRPDSAADRLGHQASLVAPVRVGERLWGMLTVASPIADRFGRDDEQTLAELSNLLATSISSAEARARLAEQALSDSLTGLANQRALRARLEAELARGARRGAPVAVAIIDIDHFKEINDTAGHETGDEMLQRVATAFRGFARTEDTVARIGGDEFAWLMPDTRREQALVAVERARQLVAAAPPDPYRITISAGICDTDSTEDPQELLRLADNALYWSKEHGRNQAWIYDPAVVRDLSEQQRAVRIERTQALEGLRALIRAREAGDPARRGHSERVAATAVSLASALGWPRERAMLLNEAATLHDIGRVTGVALPAVGASAGELSGEQLAQLGTAAAAGAAMVDGLLDDEQVAWIRGLYGPPGDTPVGAAPDGDTPDGAAILTVADLYDLMTAVSPGLPAEALGQLDRLAGSSPGAGVDPRVVEALRELLAGGGIGQPDLLR